MKISGTKTVSGSMHKSLDDSVSEAISHLTKLGHVILSITPVAAEEYLYCVIVYGEPEDGDA